MLGSEGTGVAPAARPLPTPKPEVDSETGETTVSDAEVAFDPKRRLCPDEACVGVIGSDGECSVCGRRG